MLYPLFFKPLYKEIIWGGRGFEKKFNRILPHGNIAESWEVCSHKNGISTIVNGEFQNKTLKELINLYKDEVLGYQCKELNYFPLLIKFIDANDNLSVQVHPDDDYAMKAESELGKTEMWYVIDAKEGAKIIYGVKKDTNKDSFRSAIEDGTLEKHLNYINVRKGDVVFIPSGTVHAILDGILLAEIQQNSDTTYRVYDWNRKDKDGRLRPLHVDKALDVINFNQVNCGDKFDSYSCDEYKTCTISKCSYFTVDKVEVKDRYGDKTDGSTFIAYTSIEGFGRLVYQGNSYDVPIGTSFLIPAFMGEYEILGEVTLLKSYI
jgi:mannose-6-phosphate isomerase